MTKGELNMTQDFFGSSTKVLTVAELTRAIRGTLETKFRAAWVSPFVIPSEVEESLAYSPSKIRDVSTYARHDKKNVLAMTRKRFHAN
jgi:hypothetical protein